MKQFLISLFLFFIIFLIIDKVSWYFINRTADKEYDKRLETVVQGNFEKDIIILGSSRGANNILACQLGSEIGLEVYNLSYKGASILFQEFILKTYLKFNKKPKKILLFLDHKFTLKSDETLKYRYDRLFPISKYNYINDQLIERGKRSYGSKFIGFLRINRKDFFLKKKEPNKNQILTNCGSMPHTSRNNKTLKYNEVITPYNIADEQQEKIRALKKIQMLCKDNSIELFYVFSPSFSSFNFGFYKRFKNLVSSEKNIIVYDTLNPIYKNKDYFYDVSHLHIQGAKIFTTEISTFMYSN